MTDGSKVLFSQVLGPTHEDGSFNGIVLTEFAFEKASKIIDSNAQLKRAVLEFGPRMKEWMESGNTIEPPPYFEGKQLLRSSLEGIVGKREASMFSNNIAIKYFRNSLGGK